MERTPSQEEIDRLSDDIERTREEVEDDFVAPTVQEAERRHEEGDDLMPRTDSGNPM